MPLNLGSNNQLEEEKKKQQQLNAFGLAPQSGAPGTPQTPGAAQTPYAPSVAVTPTVSAGERIDTSGLAFNPEYAQRAQALDRGIYDAQIGRHEAITNANAQNQRQMQDAAEMQEQARKALIERMAGSGRLRSSNTADRSTKLEGAYNKYQQDLGADLAGRTSQAERAFINALNTVAVQKEGLFGEQQQEEARERLAAEQAEQTRLAQEAAREQQAAILRAMQNQPAPVINMPAPPGIGYGGSGGGGGAPAPQGPNWNAGAANFDDIVNWANTMRSNYAGNRGGFNTDIARALQTDPNWSGSMQNSMGQYYGGAGNLQDVVNWLWFPQAPKLDRGISNPQSQAYANMGVM